MKRTPSSLDNRHIAQLDSLVLPVSRCARYPDICLLSLNPQTKTCTQGFSGNILVAVNVRALS